MISVGRILRSQGKEGELKLRFYRPELIRLQTIEKIYIEREGGMKEFRVESLSPRGKVCYLKLRGITTLPQADSLAGAEVLVGEESLKTLGPGEYYLHELKGCSVVNLEDVEVGVVVDVISASENTLLVVEGQGKEVLIPFHESICREVRVVDRVIRIDPPEGLLDLNEI